MSIHRLQFSRSTVSAKYKNVDREFDFHHRPLWEWVVAQVEDPKLAPYFHWDAQRLSKYDGDKWVRFYEEPWTADMFWDVQVSVDILDLIYGVNKIEGISLDRHYLD